MIFRRKAGGLIWLAGNPHRAECLGGEGAILPQAHLHSRTLLFKITDQNVGGGAGMSETAEFRGQADVCFGRATAADDEFSRAFWRSLAKQWAKMADEAEPSSTPAPTIDRGRLEQALESALS
jgi:hypothetical protein